MKNISLLVAVALITLAGSRELHAQNSDANVLSYYAMGNSLDGQPMVDMQNVLRFYPVFALREYIDSVLVTIYYGPHIYTRKSDRYDEGRYWQVQLPQFRIGEAIQRIDVETWMNLEKHPTFRRYLQKLKEIEVDLAEVQPQLKAIPKKIEDIQKSGKTAEKLLGDLKSQLQPKIVANLKSILEPTIGIAREIVKTDLEEAKSAASAISGFSKLPTDAELIEKRVDIQTNANGVLTSLERLQTKVETSLPQQAAKSDDPNAQKTIDNILDVFEEQIRSSGQLYSDYLDVQSLSVLESNTRKFDTTLVRYMTVMDSLRDRLAAVSTELIDTTLSGPSVRRGDVTIDENLKARILYRNYKPGLRSLPALDPAERLGVFRARYIPFVVRNRRLETPFSAKDGAVFEVGLGFSDVALSGDEFVKPELSIRRLGVAFAVTRELFSDSAAIRALVLTYDFNAYGSIGVGANFPGTGSMESYFSFGINRQAFEALLGAISKLFGPES